MSERPTPETDAARHDLSDYGSPVPCSYGDWVPFEVAEKLERERDEAREALRTLAEHGENEIQKLIKECDEARNKMADALQEVDLRTLDYERMKQERDEAREAAAKWESLFDATERAGSEQARRAEENREWALRAERERDEAREKAERYRLEANAMMLQREEAREKLARINHKYFIRNDGNPTV